MLGPELELNITIPEQTLASLSFVDPTPAAFTAWVQELPMANVGETARQLYQAILELNQLALPATTRSKILETLRPAIHYVCLELSKHFLNQTIALPEKQQKVANLTQALRIHLATGYKIVMLDSISAIASEKVRKNFACASHRMISEYGQVIVRAAQLYCTSPKGIWKELHQVYSFSEAIGLLKYTITDSANKHLQDTRIDQAYKRILLLSCCRPNQLRQNDIQFVYDAFELWSEHVEVGAAYSANAVFIINLQQDSSPRYRSLLHDTLSDHYYGFDTAELTSRLTDQLSALKQESDSGVVHLIVPSEINDSLLNHLNHALGILTKRTFKRVADDGQLQLCAGLSASHYYVSGGKSFKSQLLASQVQSPSATENVFVADSKKSQDAWSGVLDAGGGHNMATPAGSMIDYEGPAGSGTGPEFPIHTVPLINTSPGGYCLQWNDTMPSNIQAGEILAVREGDTQTWSIAVIRWIRHARKQGTQIGIELLAPNAQACAVQLLYRTGNPSEYLRGLLLPELGTIGQPSTLITPRMPFQEGHKVSLRYADTETKSILKSCIASTASFNQFEMSPAVALANLTATISPASESEDDFDSLWPTL